MRDTETSAVLAGFAFFLLWLGGCAALIWVGAQALHDAFGWFATEPTFYESLVVAAWAVLASLWLRMFFDRP